MKIYSKAAEYFLTVHMLKVKDNIFRFMQGHFCTTEAKRSAISCRWIMFSNEHEKRNFCFAYLSRVYQLPCDVKLWCRAMSVNVSHEIQSDKRPNLHILLASFANGATLPYQMMLSPHPFPSSPSENFVSL